MKLLKLNNAQANTITGIYNNIWAVRTKKVEDGFWWVREDYNDNYGIAKRYLKRLLAQNKISIIDMSEALDPDVIKIKAALKKETEGSILIGYEGKHITGEL